MGHNESEEWGVLDEIKNVDIGYNRIQYNTTQYNTIQYNAI